MHSVHGMHTGQRERTTQFKRWLNCHEVDPFGQPIIEPEPTEPDVAEALRQLASIEQMLSQGVRVVQVQLDAPTAAYVYERLPAQYRSRVFFI